MAWPYDSTDLDAIDDLQNYYNNNNYNASTNPGGFRLGGHLINFIPALGKVAIVAAAVALAAAAASTSATAAAASETAAAASASKLAGTSTTSVAIGSGSKSFTTQTSKFFNVGAWLNIRSAANPTLNYMIGQVTAYNSGTGALTVNNTVTGGSGTFTDWTIDISAAPGQAGATGATGTRGPSPAIQWTFSSGTSDADPGNGLFTVDNHTLASTTFIYFDNQNNDAVDVTAWLASLDDSTTTADRGRLYFQKYTDPTKFIQFKVTGTVTAASGYYKVPVALLSASAASMPFSAADVISIDFSPTGNKGLDGGGAGDTVGPSSATDSAFALFDGTTGKLLKDSTRGIGTSGANVGLLNGNNTHSGTSNFTGNVSVSSNATITHTSNSATALTSGQSGATNPGLLLDWSTATSATGLKIKSAAAAAAIALSVISSGTDESLTIDAKGAGTIALNATATGSVLLPAGTAALPGIAINGDANTGVYGVSGDVLGFSTGGTGRARIDGTALAPVSSDGLALGTSALMFSDLFLASGAVINFNNGNFTATHSAGVLAFSGDISWAGVAFTTYVPTITAGTGTYTSTTPTGAYVQFGKLVYMTAKVIVTTNGTAAGYMKISLPVAAKTSVSLAAGSGVNAVSGAFHGAQLGDANTLWYFRYDGVYGIASGHTIHVSALYEAA